MEFARLGYTSAPSSMEVFFESCSFHNNLTEPCLSWSDTAFAASSSLWRGESAVNWRERLLGFCFYVACNSFFIPHPFLSNSVFYSWLLFLTSCGCLISLLACFRLCPASFRTVVRRSHLRFGCCCPIILMCFPMACIFFCNKNQRMENVLCLCSCCTLGSSPWL